MAYNVAEHRPAHWLLLLFADRVDAIEHRPLKLLPLALLAAGVGAMALGRNRRRARWLRR